MHGAKSKEAEGTTQGDDHFMTDNDEDYDEDDEEEEGASDWNLSKKTN